MATRQSHDRLGAFICIDDYIDAQESGCSLARSIATSEMPFRDSHWLLPRDVRNG